MRKLAVVWFSVCWLVAGLAVGEDNANWESGFDLGKPLSAARGLFLQVDMRAAAAKIREGSKQMRESARDAADDVRHSLNHAADELEQVGKRVEARNIHRVEELDKAFARAFHSLARQDYLQGRRHWYAREPRPAGYRLKAAADNLERAATVTGERVNAATQEAIRESRLVSGKLIEGAGYATDEVGKTFESLGKQVETFGENVASRRPANVRSK